MKKLFLYLLPLLFNNLAPLSNTYTLPEPSGSFSVGKQVLFWNDTSRTDPFLKSGTKALEYRPLMLDLYYPATTNNLKTEKYPSIAANIIIRESKPFDHPFELSKVLSSLNTHSKINAPLANITEKLPLIIFSHGYTLSSGNNSAQCESLASHGFLVLAINHTGISGQSLLENGNIIQSCLAPRDFHTPLHACEDVNFVINYLVQNKHNSSILSKADITRIGMFGHSLGGIVTTRCSALNNYIKAGVNMDGPLFGRRMFPGFKKPFLFLLAQNFEERFGNDERALTVMNITADEFRKTIPSLTQDIGSLAQIITIQKADHNTFCDHAIIHALVSTQAPHTHKQLQQSLEVGSLNGQDAHRIIVEHLVTFFRKNL